MKPPIFLYPYAGPGGRQYLKQAGTEVDLKKHGIVLAENMVLTFYCDDADDDWTPDDLLFDGVVHFDPARECWYAVLDEQSYRHASAPEK